MTKRKLAGSEEAMVHPRQEDAQKARKCTAGIMSRTQGKRK